MFIKTNKRNDVLIDLGVLLVLSTLLLFGGMIAGGLGRFYGSTSPLRSAHQILLGVGGVLFLISFIYSFLKYRNHPVVSLLIGFGLIVLLVQAILGQLLLRVEPGYWKVGLHYGLSVIILAIITAATSYYLVSKRSSPKFPTINLGNIYSRRAVCAVLAILFVLVSGVFVSVSGARDACLGWPLCGGDILPDNSLVWVALAHRFIVSMVGVYLVFFNRNAWRTYRMDRLILVAANMLVVLYFAQAFVGAMLSIKGYPLHLLILHELTGASLISVGAILLVSLGINNSIRNPEATSPMRISDSSQRFKDFLALNKPVVVLLLLATTLGGMVIGAGGLPSWNIVLVTLVSGALAAGGSGAINQYIDRDLDGLMTRTSKRPIPAGRLTPAEGLAFGVTALLIAFYLLAGFVNILAALLTLAGMIYYIVIYSILLKKRSDQNIVIGGGAGAIPPMVGWAAATGRLDLMAYFLFLIIFLWTPPHFWALALTRKNEYAAAGIPMMPVARGEAQTKKLILQYSIALVGTSLLVSVLGLAGWIYLLGAMILGVYLLYLALDVVRKGRNRVYYRMYRHSSYYLFFLFLIMAFDAVMI
jgi:protoheme IX farnesyltransferase